MATKSAGEFAIGDEWQENVWTGTTTLRNQLVRMLSKKITGHSTVIVRVLNLADKQEYTITFYMSNRRQILNEAGRKEA